MDSGKKKKVTDPFPRRRSLDNVGPTSIWYQLEQLDEEIKRLEEEGEVKDEDTDKTTDQAG